MSLIGIVKHLSQSVISSELYNFSTEYTGMLFYYLVVNFTNISGQYVNVCYGLVAENLLYEVLIYW